MSRFSKSAWCVKCNAERPIRRASRPAQNASAAELREDDGRKRKRMRCAVCLEPVEMPSKFRNVPVTSKLTGRRFQSQREAAREPALVAEQNIGTITDLRYQVPFRLELYSTQAVEVLLDALDSVDGDFIRRLKEDVRRSRQCVARYVADYVYLRDGQLVVEDPKGARTPVYSIKKRLMVLAHNLEIQEPKPGGVQQRARGAGVRGPGVGARFKGGR